MYTAVRLVIGCIGVLSLYAGLFLKEDREGKIQNTLEALWVKISDRQDVAISKSTSFLRAIAHIVTQGLDHLLGEKILSPRAIGVSICYSMGSLQLVLTLESLSAFNDVFPEHMSEFAIGLSLAIVFILVGSLAVYIRRPVLFVIWMTALPILAVGHFVYLHFTGWFNLGGFLSHVIEVSGETQIAAFTAALIVGVLFDVFFIGATRFALKRSLELDTVPKILGVVLINILAACLLVGLPAVFVGEGLNWVFPDTIQEKIAGTVGLSNFIDLIVSLLFVVMALVMLLHRLLWPLIENPVYAIQRVGIPGRRGLFVTVGIMLFSLATGLNLERLQKILDQFHG